MLGNKAIMERDERDTRRQGDYINIVPLFLRLGFFGGMETLNLWDIFSKAEVQHGRV